MSDDFFGNQVISSSKLSDFPRVAIGEAGKENTFDKMQGVYEGTKQIKIKGDLRLQHQIKMGDKSYLVWGNYEMDDTLPTLPVGTKVRITYEGTEKTGNGYTVKKTPVEFPANVKRVANRFKVEESHQEPF